MYAHIYIYIYIYISATVPLGTSGVFLMQRLVCGPGPGDLDLGSWFLILFKGTPPPSRMACMTRVTFFYTFFDAVF